MIELEQIADAKTIMAIWYWEMKYLKRSLKIMPKPLLTDEVIEQAKQDKKNLERRLQRELEEDTEIAEKYDSIEKNLSKNAVYKSRRIENAKAQKRGKAINKWLFIVTLIVVLLAVAFFLYYF